MGVRVSLFPRFRHTSRRKPQDKNGDGGVSREEFHRALEPHREVPTSEPQASQRSIGHAGPVGPLEHAEIFACARSHRGTEACVILCNFGMVVSMCAYARG